ncbi:MAG: ABC transporter permease [Candidatus Nanoarchaeia archaeon]
MLLDFVKIAFKSLMKRRIRTWLTMIGIFIGIAAVVSLISLGQGLEKAVLQQFQAIGADRIVVQAKGAGGGPPGTNVAVPLSEDDLKVVSNTRGVGIAAGRLIRPAGITFEDNTRFAYLASMPEGNKERDFINDVSNYEVEIGRDIRPGEKYKVVLGGNFREKPVLGRELRTGDIITIQDQDFEVVGFYKVLGSFQIDGTVVMNEEVVREILEEPESIDVIQAEAVNPDNTDETALAIADNLRKRRDVKLGKENFTVETTQQILDSLKKVLSFVTYFLVAIAAISIIVGAVGITNTMYTSVLERTREIGIMKAIGARNSNILTIFLFESGLLGLVGGVMGVLLGMGLGKLVEAIGTQALGTNLIQASFSPLLIFGSLAFAFIVGVLAGTLPALRASKMSPVDALRKT